MSTRSNSSPTKIDWWVYTIPLLVVLTILFHALLFYGPGRLRFVVYYLGPLLVSFLAAFFLLFGIIRSIVKRPFWSRWRAVGFVGLLLFPISFFVFANTNGNFVSAYPSSHARYHSQVTFRLPMDGPIDVHWGGDKVATNYHVVHPDQRWAYDLLVRKEGKTFAGDSTRLESYFCYGQPVLAPASGRVMRISDTMPDIAIGALGANPPYGNHIVLRVAPSEYLVFCHLKPGSMQVRAGDSVTQGQRLALVGNSGNTSEPHLHIHLEDSDQPGDGEGIPLFFSHYKVNGKFLKSGMPRGGFGKDDRFTGEVVENVSEGQYEE